MAPSSSQYDDYKRGNRQLARWVTNMYEQIITFENKPSTKTNITHEMTPRVFLDRVRVISKTRTGIAHHATSATIPPWVFDTFRSVIEARKEFLQYFKLANSEQPDPEVEKSNKSHQFFIDTLKEAVDLLRGHRDLSSQDGPGQGSRHQDARAGIADESEQSLNKNKFYILQNNEDQAENTDGSLSPSSESSTTQHQQTKKEDQSESSCSKFEDVSPESYYIVEEKGKIDLEFQMAAIALALEWHDLRCFLVYTWSTVADHGFNIAIAGAMSNIAIAIAKRSEMAFSRDYPDCLSYEDFLRLVAPGTDPRHSKDPKFYKQHLHKLDTPLENGGTGRTQVEADSNEQLYIYAYQDFMDFVEDFHLRNNGECSKKMARELKEWDPKFKLEDATRDKRRRWRRAYTIKWLYDLVNVFSSLCEEEHLRNGREWDPRKTEWSFVEGQGGSRHLFGLDEFARFACSLAWRTKSTKCSAYIKPRHMLQLQIIVDSMSVSRGWFDTSISEAFLMPDERLHLEEPTHRDLSRFPDCKNMNPMLSYLDSFEELISRLRNCKETVRNSEYSQHADMIQKQTDRLRKLRGDTMDESDPIKLQQLQRRKILWEHSPLLCGIGLMEALDIAIGLGIWLWNQIPEPVLAIHLHNMLLKKGFIKEPVVSYYTLGDKFNRGFFSGKPAPTSDFANVLKEQIRKVIASGGTALQDRDRLSKPTNILAVLDKGRAHNLFVPKCSNMILYSLANWDV
ncbi:hypothetical protein DHEL01_v206347 [Diaporthe helianthi]|uniref:DUF6604 domain-containing protein n=1 Tax=Diaporthe helianthi TaxID=158607 RepID=A0A2P5HYF0_DIAHE|nr:hypothetical protein DHEL01_v206347 [Diaporthe helianthi]